MNNNFIQKLFPPNLSYRNFIFIPLFFSLYIVFRVFEPLSFVLENFKDRPVSVATSEMIDIVKRVTLFYRAIFFLSILLLLFTRTIIIVKEYFFEKELMMMNGISLAGSCLLLFQLTGADMSASIHFIFAMLIILATGFVFHQVKESEEKDYATIFLWTILVSISIYFFLWQLTVFAFSKSFLSLPVVLIIFGIPIYLLYSTRLVLSYRILKASQPLLYLPLLSFFSIEGFYIMNQRGHFLSPMTIFIFAFILILSLCLLQYKKYYGHHSPDSHREIIFRYMLPVVLTGIALMAFYTPVIAHDIDWFEDANHVLPLQQWHSFGKIPFLDSFSSHAFSDFAMGLLYSIMNGFNPMGVFVYQFFITVAALLIVYFFFYKISGDGFLATWIIIAYPYADYLFPSYFNFVPLAGLSFVMLFEKQNVKRYTFFFLTMLFMIVWRIDLGSSVLISGLVGLAVLVFLVPDFKFEKKNFFTALGITALIGFIIFIFAFAHSGQHTFISAKDALAYMSSFQSYGNKDLAYAHDLKYYSLYFIFPAVILLILIHSIYSISARSMRNKQAMLFCLSIIFFGIFYFSNLQRGLVRHTLAEQWDSALVSFAIFIMSGAIYLHYQNKNLFVRFFLYFIVTTLIVSNYSFATPELKKNNVYGIFTGNMNHHAEINFSKDKIQRFTESPDNKNNYAEFDEWMKKNFSPKSTFLDFSNSSMLYYFTDRVVPDYFDQIPHTAHNEYLQLRFIEDLKNYDVPVVVFSNEEKSFWDNLDGIPNPVRHYHIADYIYNHYKPAYVINKHIIWVKKEIKINIEETEELHFPASDMLLSGVIQKDSDNYFVKVPQGTMSYSFSSPVSFQDKKLSLRTEIVSDATGEVILTYETSGNEISTIVIRQNILTGNNNLNFLLNDVRKENSLKKITLQLPFGSTLHFHDLKILSADHYTDRTSNLIQTYSLNWIPYVWGNYDYNKNRLQLQKGLLTIPETIGANNEKVLPFIPKGEPEKGNYIHINARVLSGKQTGLAINYGDASGKNGAVIFTLKDDTLYHDYLVYINSQYNWFSRNNSWISLFPAENNIEVSKVEILKGY
jgi:hypothetical protein